MKVSLESTTIIKRNLKNGLYVLGGVTLVGIGPAVKEDKSPAMMN